MFEGPQSGRWESELLLNRHQILNFNGLVNHGDEDGQSA